MVLGGTLPNQTLVAPFNVVGKALHITSLGVIYKSIKVLMIRCGPKDPLNRYMTLTREGKILVGEDDLTP